MFLAVVSVFWGGPTSNHSLQILTWMTQPTGTTASTITAATLAVVGCGTYVYGRTAAPRPD